MPRQTIYFTPLLSALPVVEDESAGVLGTAVSSVEEGVRLIEQGLHVSAEHELAQEILGALTEKWSTLSDDSGD